MHRIALAAVTAAIGGLALATPQTAEACGGTFCDGGPAAMSTPVDQTGETILFVMDEGRVEAHIQIEYDPNTDAENFAWIVPVMAPPTFSVGSQQLMLNLLNATVPAYGYQNQFDFCGGGDDGGWGGFDGCDGGDGAAGGTSGADSPGDGDDGATTGGGTEVISQQTVGAFDIVVLQATTTQDLMDWLDLNGYYADPNAAPIFDEYLAEGALFAAARLTQGAGVGEIHPIVVEYEGTEACVPIRLTRVAAQDDMEIRTLFLGATRIGPRNYKHIELNPLKLDWTGLGVNYKEVVSMAVDEADGHAFVTEYAGSTSVVLPDGLYSEAWDPASLVSAQPTTVVDLLQAQGLMTCDGGSLCEYGHPLMEGILASVLPAPIGVEPGEFYNCVQCFEGLVDPDAWSVTDLVAAVETRIVEPGLHAQALLTQHPYLTRMYTTLSPHEMTADPFFMPNPDLPDVDHTLDIGTLDNECGGSQAMSLPGGRVVDLASFNLWPDIAPEQMPWVERIEDFTDRGAPIIVVDNGPVIDELLAAWNAGTDVDLRPEARSHDGCGTPHDSDTDGGPFDGEGPSGGGLADGFGNGCGCRAPSGNGAGWMLMLLGLGAGLLSRRRRD
jgi:MYXO-CTERM domain-containing protein